eukprot:m.479819 g.479819  ORF g.479819 m.479819 type:complete len:55 (-) comp21610_c0_seq1:128-292(-)
MNACDGRGVMVFVGFRPGWPRSGCACSSVRSVVFVFMFVFVFVFGFDFVVIFGG